MHKLFSNTKGNLKGLKYEQNHSTAFSTEEKEFGGFSSGVRRNISKGRRNGDGWWRAPWLNMWSHTCVAEYLCKVTNSWNTWMTRFLWEIGKSWSFGLMAGVKPWLKGQTQSGDGQEKSEKSNKMLGI